MFLCSQQRKLRVECCHFPVIPSFSNHLNLFFNFLAVLSLAFQAKNACLCLCHQALLSTLLNLDVIQ